MHQLLTMDPAAGIVNNYQALFPNNLKSKWIFSAFMHIFIPRQRPGNRWGFKADLPLEDEFAVSNITDQSFYHSFYFPSKYRYYYQHYVRFTAEAGNRVDEWKLMFRNLVIKSLINTKGRRAILKNPVHAGRLPILQDIFPKARFIFIIRNPVIAYLSCKKFFSELIPTLQLENYNIELIPEMAKLEEAHPDRFRSLIADGSSHTFLLSQFNREVGGTTTVADWVADMLSGSEEWQSVSD